MFNCYEFTFDGESSAMYGLMVYDIGGRGQSDVSFGNKASIVETRTNNRIQPIYFGTNYHSKPLEFKLVFGAERELDRYELEDIRRPFNASAPMRIATRLKSSTRFPVRLPFCSATKARCVNISSLRFRSHLHPAQELCLL